MSWRVITEADLLKKLSSDELEAIRAAGLASGQADPVSAHLADVTNFVRGFIAANSGNVLGSEGTLPERIILPAIDYLVVDIGSRVAGLLIDPEGIRKTSYDNANRLFRDIAQGNFAIEAPETESTETESAPSPSFYTKTREFSRENQDGI